MEMSEMLDRFNCSECLEFMKGMTENTVDMCFTSPPYNCGNHGKNKDMYKHYSDNLTDEEYYNLLNDSLYHMLRICKGLIFVNLNYMNNNIIPLFRFINNNTSFLRDIIIWDKGRIQPPIGNILGKKYEFIFLFCKNKEYEINTFHTNKAANYKNVFGSWLSNLITVSIKDDQIEFHKEHRAGFPTALPKIFIDIYTKPGDIVLDPFMGLGTTGIACYETGRHFIGIERESEYVEISKKRLSTYENQPKLF